MIPGFGAMARRFLAKNWISGTTKIEKTAEGMRFRDSIHVFSGYKARDGYQYLRIESKARCWTFG